MSNRNHHYNQKFDHQSWVVSVKNNELVVEHTYFIPTYTAGHFATKREAIQHAIETRLDDMKKLKNEVDQLVLMQQALDG